MGAGGETRVLLEADRGADLREAVFRECVARGWTLLELSARQATLEDVFVRLLSTRETAENAKTEELPAAVEEQEPRPEERS